jgi:putative FmdB family regulatory protein
VPTYAYACTACDHRFEVQQSFTDAALSECPQCEGRVRKLFNAVGIVFKGAGFYRTDSRGSAGSTTGSDGSSATSPASGDAAKTAPSSSGSTTGSGNSGSTTGSGNSAGTSKSLTSATSAA